MKIAVLFGGDSMERDVSAASAAQVIGLDFSMHAVSFCRKRYAALGHVAFVRGQNLHVARIADGVIRALTDDGGGPVSNGVAEFIAGIIAAMFHSAGWDLNWDTSDEVELLARLNGRVSEGPTAGRPKVESDIDACETILMLAPETNGEVAVKAWHALEKATGRSHAHLAEGREEEKIRFRDVAAQPR